MRSWMSGSKGEEICSQQYMALLLYIIRMYQAAQQEMFAYLPMVKCAISLSDSNFTAVIACSLAALMRLTWEFETRYEPCLIVLADMQA